MGAIATDPTSHQTRFKFTFTEISLFLPFLFPHTRGEVSRPTRALIATLRRARASAHPTTRVPSFSSFPLAASPDLPAVKLVWDIWPMEVVTTDSRRPLVEGICQLAGLLGGVYAAFLPRPGPPCLPWEGIGVRCRSGNPSLRARSS